MKTVERRGGIKRSARSTDLLRAERTIERKGAHEENQLVFLVHFEKSRLTAGLFVLR
jgi:hypothetical protein